MKTTENTSLAAEIGVRLRAFRESESFSQKGLAVAVGGTLRGIQDNESGKSAPNSKVLKALAGRGLNVNWLLTGSGPMLLADLVSRTLQNAKIDQGILTHVIETLDEELKRRKQSRSSVKYAEMVGILYDYCQETGQKDNLMAARLAKIA
jgi:transcriptional regulator with XRE-family HTH domain